MLEESSLMSLCSAGFSEFLFIDDHKCPRFWTVIFSSTSVGLPYALREVLEFDTWQKILVHPDFLRHLSFN